MLRLATRLVLSVLFASPAAAQVAVPTATLSETAACAPGSPTASSFGSLFRTVGGDFRRLPSRDTAIILGVAGGLSLGAHHNDVPFTRTLTGSRALDAVFEPGAPIGDGLTQAGGALAIYVLGRATRRPRVSAIGAELVRAQVMNSVLTLGIKVSVGRRRPDGTRFSLPSGHTSSTFATAAVLQRRFGWKAALPAYGLAALVAGSRLQENKHFLSDVIFGAGIGIVSGRAVTVGSGTATFAAAPFAVAGGAGVGFTWVGRQ